MVAPSKWIQNPWSKDRPQPPIRPLNLPPWLEMFIHGTENPTFRAASSLLEHAAFTNCTLRDERFQTLISITFEVIESFGQQHISGLHRRLHWRSSEMSTWHVFRPNRESTAFAIGLVHSRVDKIREYCRTNRWRGQLTARRHAPRKP